MNTVSTAQTFLRACFARARGFSLVELMVAMVLGLLVSGSAVGIFISNRQANRATDSLSRIQENARTAFELMARDIREAGGNPCGNNLLVTSVINDAGINWWASLANPVLGYDENTPFPDGAGIRVGGVDGTDAIEIKSADAGSVTVINSTPPVSAQFTVNTASHGLNDGDIVVVCDSSQATVLQITGPSATNANIVHNTGGKFTPGNCTKELGFPTVCGPGGTGYVYGANSALAKLKARRWFIGTNLRGGRSLYQAAMRNDAGVTAVVNEEIVEGVTDMQITYLLGTAANYVDASVVTPGGWNQVRAVHITLTMQGLETVGTDGGVLNRSLAQTVALRNRMP